jgi:hypothetical protein
MDANTLVAIAAVIGAVTGLINSVVAAATLAQGRRNAGAIEQVAVQSNGHTTMMLDMLKDRDPAIAAEAAAKVLKTAQDAARPP